MISEGIELTRGTKKIIQEAIDTISDNEKYDRIRIVEEFCRIVEDRYTGGAMSYQLSRMGNTYPFSILERNNWTIQDAIESEIIVSLSNDWFSDKQLKDVDGEILQEQVLQVTAFDGENQTLIEGIDNVRALDSATLEDLSANGLVVADDQTESHVLEVSIWEPVSDELSFHMEQKLYWLKDLQVGRNIDKTTSTLDTNEILNFSKAQAKAYDFAFSKESIIKIPLHTTGPIQEAVDKFLYDKTGQFSA